MRGTPADETGRPASGVGPGTGRGTRVLVHYTPWYWWGPRGGVRLGRAPGSPYIAWEDEVLLHELVHAAQQTRGADSCVATTHGYDTYTEFCAVTVESMYMSCTPDRPVRNNHHGGAEVLIRRPGASTGGTYCLADSAAQALRQLQRFIVREGGATL